VDIKMPPFRKGLEEDVFRILFQKICPLICYPGGILSPDGNGRNAHAAWLMLNEILNFCLAMASHK